MNPIDPKQYENYLEEFILRLRKDLDSLTADKFNSASEQICYDKYLLELNSFYYDSFNQTFFPRYKQIIEEDIRKLNHIGTQEETLKKDIVMIFRQYARLFNRIKTNSAIIKSKRQELQLLLNASMKTSDERGIDLLYILKEAAAGFNSILALIQDLQTLLEDEKLLTSLSQYPAHAAAGNLIYEWEPEDTKAAKSLTRLTAAWQLAVKTLIKLQENQAAGKEVHGVINDLKDIDISWDNRKAPALLRSWYKRHIQKTYMFYLEEINFYTNKKDSKHLFQAARQLEEWLGSLLYVLEQCLQYKSRGWGNFIINTGQLTRIDQNYLKDLFDYLKKTLNTLEELIQSLSSSTRADYQFHSLRSSKLLGETYQYLRLQENNINSKAVLLGPYLNRLNTLINMLENRIDFLDEKEAFFNQTTQQYELAAYSLESYLELLSAMKEDLERILAPRNIKRKFKDINLSIEHTAITKGSPFPQEYYYLIDSLAVETQENAESDGQVLHEEGDIFIIHLDDLKEEIIPKIIIAKKG